jgi:hypothetical protein
VIPRFSIDKGAIKELACLAASERFSRFINCTFTVKGPFYTIYNVRLLHLPVSLHYIINRSGHIKLILADVVMPALQDFPDSTYRLLA